MSERLRIGIGGLVLAAALTAVAPASADWPTPRHDTRRTGVSALGSDIHKPGVYWRAHLGGKLAPEQVYVGDVNGDSQEDILYLAGGEMVLAGPTGNISWHTGLRGYTAILGVVDLDVDGQTDIVVQTVSYAAIVNGVTGQIAWEEPHDEIGTPGTFRIADLTGDGVLDLWIDSCGCCAVENGSPGILYSFAGGFGAATKLGTAPPHVHCNPSSNTIGDFDGDGSLEMMQTGDHDALMFRADGTVFATSGDIPPRAFRAHCETVDLNGQPGDELVCFLNSAYAGAGERGMFALAYRPNQSPSIKLLWNVEVSAAEGGDAVAPSRLTVDLDGDGHLEAVVSGKLNSSYMAFVLDAVTGSELAAVAGTALGDVPGPDSTRRLLVGTNSGVSAYALGTNPPGLTPVWTLASQRGLTRLDDARALRSGHATSMVMPDLDGDGQPDLVLASMTEPVVLTGYRLGSGAPVLLGSHALDPGVATSAVGLGVASKVFVARNDGFVSLLDGSMKVTNLLQDNTVTLPGMRVGGHYTGSGGINGEPMGPIAGKLKPGDSADSLLVVDSRGDLVVINPKGATNIAPAKPGLRISDASGAAMRPAGAGPGVIGAFRRRHPVQDPPVYVMAALDPDGTEVASLELAKKPLWDVMPGDLAGDGSTRFVGAASDSSKNIDVVAMGAGGELVWQQSFTVWAGMAPLAVADWNGDGADDVAMAAGVAQLYSGKDGSSLGAGTDQLAYFMPILASLEGGPQLQMVLQGGYDPVLALDHDLKLLWKSNGPKAPYPYGALAACGAVHVLVEGSWSEPSQLTFTHANGPMSGLQSAVVLASGASYTDTVTAVAAGAKPGQLGDVAVSTDLDGNGGGPTALVGSTDGHLYALDVCSATLVWTLSFGMPVGGPILADTDGDSKDEILVSVADGYLYAIKDEVLPAPSHVWDTDPPHGILDKDVDAIETTGTLHAAWAPVSSATSYEVAIVGVGGTYITNPSWLDVGAVTTATIANLPLVNNAKYFIGVRAVSAKGKSPDRSSDGVLVNPPVTPDGGTGGAGGSSTTSPTTSSVSSGAGGETQEILVSGRACTCSTPGGGSPNTTSVPWGSAAAAAAFAARARRRSRPR